jgi:uncharacterized protein YdeI (YjbR/CyaY-like superfamily)
MGEESERGGLPILLFEDAAALERWLGAQPAEHPGIWLKFAKKGSGERSIMVREAIDAGLCFGWIDGLKNAFDERFFLLRYTSRRPRSKWSLINVERAEALLAEGRVRPGGLKQIDAAKADGRWAAAYPPASRMDVPPDLAAALEADPEAKAAFAALKGGERYSVLYRLHQVPQGSNKRAAVIAAVVAGLMAS